MLDSTEHERHGCGNTMPDLSDLVPFHSGQVENFYSLVLGQVQNKYKCITAKTQSDRDIQRGKCYGLIISSILPKIV